MLLLLSVHRGTFVPEWKVREGSNQIVLFAKSFATGPSTVPGTF